MSSMRTYSYQNEKRDFTKQARKALNFHNSIFTNIYFYHFLCFLLILFFCEKGSYSSNYFYYVLYFSNFFWYNKNFKF